MAGNVSKKRKVEEGMKGKTGRPVKKFKKQTYYESSSEDESATAQDFQAVNLQDSDEEENNATNPVTDEDDEPNLDAADNDAESEVTDGSNSDSESSEDDDSDTNSNPNLIRKRKRNDPEAFATSMSKILGSKLSASKRSDPVLSRSVTAIEASKEMTDLALEKKAKNKMREEKKAALEKGRVKDVLGASTAFDASNGHGTGEDLPSVQETMELEKRLRKTAQRGVVKLFNAVRAAQIKGEEAAREARQKGVVGQGRREEKINEMSKKGFLELIAGGGGLKKGEIEEA
ncbi:pre-60S ribosomal particles component [Clarireedia jacksonii]